MERHINYILLKNFLKENNIYINYFNNIYRKKIGYSPFKFFNYQAYDCPIHLFSRYFSWSESEEGYLFWENIYKKWQKYYKSFLKKYYIPIIMSNMIFNDKKLLDKFINYNNSIILSKTELLNLFNNYNPDDLYNIALTLNLDKKLLQVICFITEKKSFLYV